LGFVEHRKVHERDERFIGEAKLYRWTGPIERLELVKRSKGTRGMPRRGQARKDAASCDKPWLGARIL
jgi:hypothetical protein